MWFHPTVVTPEAAGPGKTDNSTLTFAGRHLDLLMMIVISM